MKLVSTVKVKLKIWRRKLIEIVVNTCNHRVCGTIGSYYTCTGTWYSSKISQLIQSLRIQEEWNFERKLVYTLPLLLQIV